MEYSGSFTRALERQVDESTRIFRVQDGDQTKTLTYVDREGTKQTRDLPIHHMQGSGEYFAPKTVRVEFSQM